MLFAPSPTPQLLATVPTSKLGGLDVMSMTQEGSWLYLALGNFFASAKQTPGFAVLDLSTLNTTGTHLLVAHPRLDIAHVPSPAQMPC